MDAYIAAIDPFDFRELCVYIRSIMTGSPIGCLQLINGVSPIPFILMILITLYLVLPVYPSLC